MSNKIKLTFDCVACKHKTVNFNILYMYGIMYTVQLSYIYVHNVKGVYLRHFISCYKKNVCRTVILRLLDMKGFKNRKGNGFE